MTTALTPEQRIADLEAELAKLCESECDKIMAMSEEQITALTRMQGSNPDDVAKIGKMACDLALKDVAIQRLEAELAACKRDAERYQWLRNPEAPVNCDRGFPIGVESISGERLWMKQLDRAIDAAMAAQEKK